MGRKLKKKNYAFIDSQNLNVGVKSLGWRLDFRKFRIFLKEAYGIQKAFLFVGYLGKNKKLYAKLRRNGYVLIFKPVLKKGSCVKGNVDAELVLHTMIEWKNYEKAVIVSGDGDFYCLVEYLEEKKKLLKIIAPNNLYSSLFRTFEEYLVTVPDFKNKVAREKR